MNIVYFLKKEKKMLKFETERFCNFLRIKICKNNKYTIKNVEKNIKMKTK